VLDTKEFCDLTFVILCVIPWDPQVVRDLDIVLFEIVEDCGSVWGGLDHADEVIKVVVKIEPQEFGLEDPMESFAENVEKKRRCREPKWKACFLVVPPIYLKP
jgi:hypothetical protein